MQPMANLMPSARSRRIRQSCANPVAGSLKSRLFHHAVRPNSHTNFPELETRAVRSARGVLYVARHVLVGVIAMKLRVTLLEMFDVAWFSITGSTFAQTASPEATAPSEAESPPAS